MEPSNPPESLNSVRVNLIDDPESNFNQEIISPAHEFDKGWYLAYKIWLMIYFGLIVLATIGLFYLCFSGYDHISVPILCILLNIYQGGFVCLEFMAIIKRDKEKAEIATFFLKGFPWLGLIIFFIEELVIGGFTIPPNAQLGLNLLYFFAFCVVYYVTILVGALQVREYLTKYPNTR